MVLLHGMQVRHDCPPETLLAVLTAAVKGDTFAAAGPHAQAQSAVGCCPGLCILSEFICHPTCDLTQPQQLLTLAGGPQRWPCGPDYQSLGR